MIFYNILMWYKVVNIIDLFSAQSDVDQSMVELLLLLVYNIGKSVIKLIGTVGSF